MRSTGNLIFETKGIESIHTGSNLPKTALIISLYVPWLLASALQAAPLTSYWIAWIGSIFIFYQTWLSSYRFILPDLPVHEQIMRPLFLQQFIFAGFMCCTSVFYLFDTLGYQYFVQVNTTNPIALQEQLLLIAKCQRLSVLGHAAFVTGILALQSRHFWKRPAYWPSPAIPKQIWIIRTSIILFFVSLVLGRISALYQFSIGLYDVAIIGGAIIFVQGIVKKQLNFLIWGGCLFIMNVLNSTLSGYKEPIIVNFILIGCFLYPYHRRLVTILAVPAFVILLYFSTTYTMVFREQSWQGKSTAEEARSQAFESILQEDDEVTTPVKQNNWDFLAYRFSEIGMFTEFARTIPDITPYYYTELPKNALLAIIPRALWEEKPSTEMVAMERVYIAGIAHRSSNVSAKTRPIVDGYVSAGIYGVILYMLLLGCISQWFCNKAENLFGGYGIGCIIMYNGFFQQLWRGETIEFMVNTVFWSFIAMLLLHKIMRLFNFVQKFS